MTQLKWMLPLALLAAGCSGAGAEAGDGSIKQGANAADKGCASAKIAPNSGQDPDCAPANGTVIDDPCASVRVASDGVCAKDQMCDPDCIDDAPTDGCASAKIGPGMGPDPDCAPPVK